MCIWFFSMMCNNSQDFFQISRKNFITCLPESSLPGKPEVFVLKYVGIYV
jgi:hypothetical protein